MAWTKELPTKTGFYWWRRYRYKAVCMCYVWQDKASHIWYYRYCGDILYDYHELASLNPQGDWWGPLTLTEEQEIEPCNAEEQFFIKGGKL
jgi:hypothetical protein